MIDLTADRNAVSGMTEGRAKLFRGLADPSRLSILEALCDGQLAVGDIVERTELTQSNVSNHLRCLSECVLVVGEREGRSVRYQISNPQVANLLIWADAILDAVAVGIETCGNYQR